MYSESQEKAENSQNKENILNNSHGFTVLVTQLAFLPRSQNKGVVLDSYSSEIFLPYAKSFIDNVLLIKMARYFWRNIPFKIQSGYFPYRKINFRVGNQLTGSVIVGLFQTSSLSAISRV